MFYSQRAETQFFFQDQKFSGTKFYETFSFRDDQLCHWRCCNHLHHCLCWCRCQEDGEKSLLYFLLLFILNKIIGLFYHGHWFLAISHPVPDIGGEHREDENHDISEARGLGKKKILWKQIAQFPREISHLIGISNWITNSCFDLGWAHLVVSHMFKLGLHKQGSSQVKIMTFISENLCF